MQPKFHTGGKGLLLLISDQNVQLREGSFDIQILRALAKMEPDTAKFKRPVELSPSLVAQRLSRLEKVGVLRKIHSSTDPRLKPSKTVACFACWAIFATDPTIVFQFDKFLEYRIIGKRSAAWFITPRHPSNLDMS